MASALNSGLGDQQAFRQDSKSVCPSCTIGPAQKNNL